MGPAQRIDDEHGLGVRRRGQPHRHRAGSFTCAHQIAGLCGAGQPPGNAGDGASHRGRAAVRPRERYHPIVVTTPQQCRVGAAVGEHRLVGVTGNDGELSAGRQHPHKTGGLRVEVLGVVDKQQLDPRAFGREQPGVDGECLQCGADEFGRAQRGHGGLRGGHTDGGPQQHRLLVLLCELARGEPFGATG